LNYKCNRKAYTAPCGRKGGIIYALRHDKCPEAADTVKAVYNVIDSMDN